MKHQKKIIACSVVAIIAYVMTNFPHEIRTRQSGLELIGQAESCMHEPYLCPAGVWTVGVGSTGNVASIRFILIRKLRLSYPSKKPNHGGNPMKSSNLFRNLPKKAILLILVPLMLLLTSCASKPETTACPVLPAAYIL